MAVARTGWRRRVWRKPPKGSRVADGDTREVNTTTDRQFRDPAGTIVAHRPQRGFITPRTSAAADRGTDIDGREEGDRVMPIEQRRSIDGECPGRSERRIAEPHAGPNECVASALLGPEEHMPVDMTPPEVWASGKATGQCRTQPTIRHQLRPQDSGSPPRDRRIRSHRGLRRCAAER